MGRPEKATKAELLEIAREVLITEGVSGVAKKVAKKAGISEAAVIGRLGKKRAMVAAALKPPGFNSANFFPELSRQNGGRDALVASTERMLDYVREAVPRLMPILGEPPAERKILLQQLGRNPAMTLQANFAVHLRKEAKAPRIACEDTNAASALLIFALYGAALLEALHGQKLVFSGIRVETLVDILWRGLRPHPKKKKQIVSGEQKRLI